jgi:hypothetical protein
MSRFLVQSLEEPATETEVVRNFAAGGHALDSPRMHPQQFAGFITGYRTFYTEWCRRTSAIR